MKLTAVADACGVSSEDGLHIAPPILARAYHVCSLFLIYLASYYSARPAVTKSCFDLAFVDDAFVAPLPAIATVVGGDGCIRLVSKNRIQPVSFPLGIDASGVAADVQHNPAHNACGTH